MTTRIPAVIKNVLTDHAGKYPASIEQALQDLHDEVVEDRPIQPLQTTTPDGASWAKAWQPHQNSTWLDSPWYFAEAFFYRRLLAAAGYFENGEWAGVDPYLPRKEAELQSEAPRQILSTALRHSQENSADSFRRLLHHCLWGNRADLSYTKIAEAVGGEITVESERANLLVDDSEAVLAYLQRSRTSGETGLRIDFICDNAGTELLMDLALTDFLLRSGWAEQVVLHVKAQPTFVSDTTGPDVEMTLSAIKKQPSAELQALADRLETYRQPRRCRIESDLFWNSSRFFWEIPPALQKELAQAQLVIFKGDANYRRLLGDSRWPTIVPISDAVPYLPMPFVALRTMKSDPVVGLHPGQAEAVAQKDPEWRVNGKRGMIQALLK
jgi:uncharacterized protein with ATP-grasp and redox domains